jgi:hypothetical protein
MLLMLAIYGVAAAAAPWLVGRLGTRAFVVLSVVPAAAFVGILTTRSDARDGTPYTESVTWIPGLDVDLAFRLDTLSWAMSLLVTGVGALVLFYCWRYFSDDEPGLGRFAATLTGRPPPTTATGQWAPATTANTVEPAIASRGCPLPVDPTTRRPASVEASTRRQRRRALHTANGKRRIALRSWLLAASTE